MGKRIVAAVLTGLWLPGGAMAGELQDIAGKAEAQAEAGKKVEALATMREGLLALWAKTPLQFRRAFFVSEKAAGFGVYKRRADGPFKEGETLFVYVEPVGYGWKQDGAVFRSDMIADFELRDAGGKVLGGQKGFGKFGLASHARNTEYFMNLTFGFTGLPAGKYVVTTKLHDDVSGQENSFELPFEVK